MAVNNCLRRLLKLRIPFYPSLFQKKILVAYAHVHNLKKSETIKLAVKNFITDLPKGQVEYLLKIYSEDIDGEIRKKEGENYIND